MIDNTDEELGRILNSLRPKIQLFLLSTTINAIYQNNQKT